MQWNRLMSAKQSVQWLAYGLNNRGIGLRNPSG